MKLNYFNFKKFNDRILMTNDMGRFAFVNESEFKQIISGNIESGSELENQLLDKEMIYDENDLEYSSKNKYALRESKFHINTATSLHIFVVTTACNMNCVYCQANNGMNTPHLFMDNENAERSVDVALQSPEKFLTFEFQGGEPLLNYKVIKHIVEYTEERKQGHHISYNVVSNLTLLTDEMIEFFSKYDFGISTSVDGPENVHNCNRTFANGTGSYEKVVCKIEKIREAGLNIGAIQTTTKESLNYSKEIVMTYKELGFRSIFIRPLTPLGKATVNWNEIGYTAEEFMDFYKRVMEEVLRLNKQGYYMSEGHSSILLNKMKGKFVNYMELRSPCGGGIGQLAYYADGNVFTCDEGRMLYEMGQNTFCLGNVKKNNFNEIVNNGVCRTVCKASILEALPSCCDCVYQPYCGICPVVNYALDKDIIEKKPRGYRCKIYSGMLDFLFEKIYNGEQDTINILNSWGE